MTKKKIKPILTPDDILGIVRSRSTEEGDCWLWDGAMTGGGTTPNMRHPAMPRAAAVSTRGIVLECLGKKKPAQNMWAVATCDQGMCVAPEHAAWRTRRQKLRAMGRLGVWSSEEITRKKAAAGQSKSPLDWDKVRDIRSRPAEVTNIALAKEFSVDPVTIRRVRLYLSWVEYATNPFAGLFTGLAANDGERRRA